MTKIDFEYRYSFWEKIFAVCPFFLLATYVLPLKAIEFCSNNRIF